MTVGLTVPKQKAKSPSPPLALAEEGESIEDEKPEIFSSEWKKKAAEAAFTALLMTGIVAFNLLPLGTLPTMLDWYLLVRVAGATFLSVFAINMGIDYTRYKLNSR